jgi:hypothetical protein
LGHLHDEALFDQQRQGLHGSCERARRRPVQRTREPRREHVDLVGAERDGLRQRRVVGHTADQDQALALNRGKHTRDGRAGQDGAERVPVVEGQLPAAQQVGDDDMQRDHRVLEVSERQVAFDQSPQGPVRAQQRPASRDRPQVTERVEREDLLAPETSPNRSQLLEGGGLGAVTGDERRG